MSTTSTRASAKTSAERATGPDGMTEFARQQLSVAVEATTVLYRAAEAVQQIQQQMTHRSAQRYRQMADQLRSASSPADMLAIQSSLFTSGLQEFMQYLQDMAAASMKMQGDMMGRGADQPPTGAAAAASAAASNPMLQAWQTMFNAPLNGATGAAASH